MTTNDEERDFSQVGKQRFPGRFDPKLLQNVDDAGDGYPGLQKAIRNWHDANKFDVNNDSNWYFVETEAELNAAITSIGSDAGVIILKTGTITLTGSININGGGSYIIMGMGQNSIIQTAAGANHGFSVTNCTSCVFKDFKINATGQTGTTGAIYINDYWVLVDNVFIENSRNGIYGYNTGGIVIRSCNIDNHNRGIFFDNVIYSEITGCLVQSANDANILLENCAIANIIISNNRLVGGNNSDITIGQTSYQIVITGNTFFGSASSPIGVAVVQTSRHVLINDNSFYNYVVGNVGVSISNSEYVMVDGNFFEACAYPVFINDIGGSADHCSVTNNNMKQGVRAIITNAAGGTIQHCNFSNNTISNFERGIQITSTADYCTISGNYISNIDKYEAITVSGGRHTIIGNTIRDVDRNNSDIYPAIENSAAGTAIVGNSISSCRNAGSGYITGIYNSADYCTISGNLVHNNNTGIVNTGDYVSITGNTCTNNIHTTDNCYGIYLNVGSYNTIVGNNMYNNGHDGIYVLNSIGVTVSGNQLYYNQGVGIRTSGGQSLTINNNVLRANTEEGIIVSNTPYSTVIGNSVVGNELDGIHVKTNANGTAIIGNNCSAPGTLSGSGPLAGIKLSDTVSYCRVVDNYCNNYQNNGAGTGYGIYVGSGCTQNSIINNLLPTTNDQTFYNVGNFTRIELLCNTQAEIQQGLDGIGSTSGVIKIGHGAISATSVITISGGGSYVIEGQGDATVLTSGNNSVFSVTSVASCVFRDFKINASGLTTSTLEVINVTDGPVTIDNVTIEGDGTNGYGIEINSTECQIKNCRIANVNYGIRVVGGTGNECRIVGNYVGGCTRGIELASSQDNVVNSNHVDTNDYGIYVGGASDNNTITGNHCFDNTIRGIEINGSDYNTITGNTCNGNNADSATDGGGIWIDADSNENTINGNTCNGNSNIGSGTGYGIIINNSNCDNNTVVGNTALNNDTQYSDSGTGTVDDSSDGTTNSNLNNFG